MTKDKRITIAKRRKVNYYRMTKFTAARLLDAHWSQLRYTLVCPSLDPNFTLQLLCDYHLTISVLDHRLINIFQKAPLFELLTIT